MRKSGYYWVKTMNTTGGEEVIAEYVSEKQEWALPGSEMTIPESSLLVLSNELLPPGKDWKLPSDPPPELKAVLVWAQGNKATGYAIAYVEKASDGSLKWWEAQATINSAPLTVLFWQELAIKPSE